MTNPTFTCTILMRGKPKARPRVTGKHSYMPPTYMQWKRKFALLLAAQRPPKFESHIDLAVCFEFAKMTTADSDNLIGGVMDAAQGVLYDNDRQVQAQASIKRKSTRDAITVMLWDGDSPLQELFQ